MSLQTISVTKAHLAVGQINIEHRNVSDVPRRKSKTKGVENRRTEFRVTANIIIIQFNSLFIYVLSSTAGAQLQSQHGI
jgi:hypothetical protein